MITKGKNKAKIYKGEYKPVKILKNDLQVAGFTETGFTGDEAEFFNTYDSCLKLFGKTEYSESYSGDPSPDNERPLVSASGTIKVTDINGAAKEYPLPELNGFKSYNKNYNYTEGGKNYISDYLYGDKIVRNIGVYTFTGNETISSYKATDSTFGFSTKEVLCENWHSFTAYCNYLSRLNSAAADAEGFAPGDGSGRVYLKLLKTRGIETPDDFKAFLKELYDKGSPLTIYYGLYTPITESVTSPIIKTHPNYTKIEVLNNHNEATIGTSNCIKIHS